MVPEALPGISDALIRDLWRWQCDYDWLCNNGWFTKHDVREADPDFPRDWFNRRGETLAARLRSELGPRWSIWHHPLKQDYAKIWRSRDTVIVPIKPLLARLDALRARGQDRWLRRGGWGLDFASNDYLGLAGHAAIADAIRAAIDRGVPTGSGGSRLLRGQHEAHELLEREAGIFFGTSTAPAIASCALYFANGFTANSALLSTLPGRGDLIVADALIHASAHEGMRLSRAENVLTAHNDAQAMDDAITAWRNKGGAGTPWIVAETLYSMDGDIAPVDDLFAVAQRHEGMLILDEAHATGVFGVGGRGLAAHIKGDPRVVALHTCGKALGTEGAIVTADPVVIDMLINRARGFIYSTAPSPLMAEATRAALRIVEDAEDRRDRLFANIARVGEVICAPLGLPMPVSPIVPIIIGESAAAMAIAQGCQQAGFDLRAIRPPTVPLGTSRLRLAITCNVTGDEIDALASILVPLVLEARA